MGQHSRRSPAFRAWTLKLPGNVKVSFAEFKVNRNFGSFKMEGLQVLIQMPQRQGLSGWCGNFDGDEANDAFPKDGPFTVSPQEDQFPGKEGKFACPAKVKRLMGGGGGHLGGVRHGNGLDCKAHPNDSRCAKKRLLMLKVSDQRGQDESDGLDTLDRGLSEAIVDCPPHLKAHAIKTCQDVPEEAVRSACVFDVCVTGVVNVSKASYGMEMMEAIAGKGIPVLDGTGKCLDSLGKRYSSYQKKDVLNAEQCEGALRTAANSDAVRDVVRGAQHWVDTCEILTEPDTEEVMAKWGGDGLSGITKDEGSGIVGSSSGEKGWRCWKVV